MRLVLEGTALVGLVQSPRAIPLTTERLGIENDTPFDLWVKFGGSPPPQPASNIARQFYHGVVRAYTSAVFPVGGTFPDGQPWDGAWYFSAFDPAGLAATGITSTRQAIYGVAYEAGETPPVVNAMPRQQDLTSQPRIVTLPVGGGANSNFRGLIAANGFAGGVYLGDLAVTPPSGVWPANLGLYLTYFYSIILYGTSGLNQDLALSLVQKNAGGTILSQLDFLFWSQAAAAAPAATTLRETFALPLGPAPLSLGFAPFSAAVTAIGLVYYIQNGTAGYNHRVQCGATVDAFSGAVIPPIGQGAPLPTGVF